MQNKKRINLSTTHERKNFIATAAAYCDTTLSTFLLKSAEQRGKEVLQEQMEIQLSVKDWDAFSKILDEAETKSRPKLKILVKEHSMVECSVIE